jgi:hypothetical protein
MADDMTLEGVEAVREVLVAAALEEHRGQGACEVQSCTDYPKCVGCQYLEAAVALSKAILILRGGWSAAEW